MRESRASVSEGNRGGRDLSNRSLDIADRECAPDEIIALSARTVRRDREATYFNGVAVTAPLVVLPSSWLVP
jgi:hypothetical protein